MHPLMSEAEVRYRQRRLRDEAKREHMVRQPALRARSERHGHGTLPGVLGLPGRLFGRGPVRPSPKAVLSALRLRGKPGQIRMGTETSD